MANHKGEKVGDDTGPQAGAARRVRFGLVIALPLLTLVPYALRLPMPLPRLTLPVRDYVTKGAGLEDALRASEGQLGTVRVELGAPPSMADVAAAREHYRKTGMPVAFKAYARPGADSPLEAYSLSVAGDGSPSMLTLLLDEAAAAGQARVSIGGRPALSPSAVGPDRRLVVPITAADSPDAGSGGAVVVELEAGPPESSRTARVAIADASPGEPRVLLATRRTGARSVIEALRPVRTVSYDELGGAGIYRYELIVLDGPDLSSLDGGVAEAIATYVERGAGSLLVAVDSPEVGKPGDCPAIEGLLPVDLSPRALSRLPDVAMAVALDVSGSMYGDKLSLAKAIGLELFANLKATDEAGIILFDEEARWLYPLASVGRLDAERSLAPLRAGGGTRLFPAVAEAIGSLEASGMPEKRLVVVSDGITEPADFDALAARAFRSGIAISAMAVGGEYDKALLTRLSAGSGGRFYRVRDASEVPSLIIEDRKSVSRTVFSESRVAVVDMAGRPAGHIDGMARLGPRPDALAFYSSAAGDPLLATRRVGSRSTVVYASDLYGRYGREFLENPGTLSLLDALLDGISGESAPALTVTETADGLALTLAADYLVEPWAAIADGSGRVVANAPFERVAPGHFHVAPGRLPIGSYTALVEDRGRTIARVALVYNGGMEGRPSDSAAAAAEYRPPFWALPRSGSPWLIAFFSSSLVATVILRFRR